MFRLSSAVLLAALIIVLSPSSLAFPFKSFIFDSISRPTCMPYEVHLSFGNSPDKISLSWRTDSNQCPSSVRYGLVKEDDSKARTVSGTSYLITEKQMCEAPASQTPFTVVMHSAVLRVSAWENEYWYRIGDDSIVRYFRAPKGPDTSAEVRFVAVGDVGAKKQALTTIKRIEDLNAKFPLDFMIHIGDLAYADGRFSTWDKFMGIIEPLSSKMPYMVGVGNHEYDYVRQRSTIDPSGQDHYLPTWGNFDTGDSGGECGAMTALRFQMPKATSSQNPPFWYSFDYGAVHFVVISSEHDISPGSMQRVWLEYHLSYEVDRCRTPWLVLSYHRPMYVVYPHKDNRMIGQHLKRFLEDLLVRHKVDVTISGHVHSYYRTCPVNGGLCDPQRGVAHLVIGTGGHPLSGVTGSQEEWVKATHVDYGFGVFTIKKRSMSNFRPNANATTASNDGFGARAVTTSKAAAAGAGPETDVLGIPVDGISGNSSGISPSENLGNSQSRAVQVRPPSPDAVGKGSSRAPKFPRNFPGKSLRSSAHLDYTGADDRSNGTESNNGDYEESGDSDDGGDNKDVGGGGGDYADDSDSGQNGEPDYSADYADEKSRDDEDILHFQFIRNKDGEVADEVYIRPKVSRATCHLYGGRKQPGNDA